MKLWEGRFAAPTAADADKFNESLSFDKKLYKADITASLAHSEMLGRCNIISEEDKTAIQEGLKSVLSDIESGKLEIAGQEDIHSFVENELVSRIGRRREAPAYGEEPQRSGRHRFPSLRARFRGRNSPPA